MKKDLRDRKKEPLGVLAVWNDVDPQVKKEYNEWYIQQLGKVQKGQPHSARKLGTKKIKVSFP